MDFVYFFRYFHDYLHLFLTKKQKEKQDLFFDFVEMRRSFATVRFIKIKEHPIGTLRLTFFMTC